MWPGGGASTARSLPSGGGAPSLMAAEDAIDLSAIFDAVADPLYIDAYHLSESGNAAIAEAMLPALVKAAAACRGDA